MEDAKKMEDVKGQMANGWSTIKKSKYGKVNGRYVR